MRAEFKRGKNVDPNQTVSYLNEREVMMMHTIRKIITSIIGVSEI